MNINLQRGGGHVPSIETSFTWWLWGMFLVFTSLCLDGITGGLQDRLIEKENPSSYRLMFNSNLWAILFLIIGIVQSFRFLFSYYVQSSLSFMVCRYF
jgi:hypothetical protein